MGLFDKLIKRDNTPDTTQTVPSNNQSLEPNTQIATDVLLQALLNSETITREQALTLPAVSGAVSLISNMIASMPIKLYKYKQGRVEAVEDDPRVRLLNGDTGDTLDAWQLKQAMVEDYLMDKGGYCYIKKNRNEVTGLYYVKPIYVQTIPNFKPIFKDYQILVLGEEHYKHEFIKLLRNTKDGATGIGLTQEVGQAIETAYNTLLYQLNMVKSGGNKKGFLKSQRKLGQDEINVLKQAWNNLYGNNKENVVVLNNGLEFQESSNNAVEMQMNDSRKTLNDEINNLFHIYPNDFYLTFKEAIYPITKAFETALNRELLLEKEKKNMFFEFDIKEIIKANVKERYEAYKIAKETGWLSFNEIRRMENMNYIEGYDVANVGLGAVLFDFNTHQYYTPNTDTVTSPSDGVETGAESQTTESIQNVLTDKVLDTEFEESGNSSAREERFNPNHDLKTGRFGFGSGGGSGSSGSSGSSKSSGGSSSFKGSTGGSSSSSKSDSSKDNSDSSSDKGSSTGGSSGSNNSNSEISEIENKIKELKKETEGKSMFDPQVASKYKQIQELNQQLEAKQKGNKEQKPKNNEDIKSKSKEKELPVTPTKEKQFNEIQKTNKMTDDYHTGIRKPSDIKSPKEAFKTTINDDDDYLYPDFTKKDGEIALQTGKITVYSSKPIEQGGFISPSKMMAQDYSSNGKVYSKEVNVNDVAWIDSNEGQIAKVKE